MGIETSGRIHKVFEAKQITERFRKREFVIALADNSRYPQLVMFQLTGDRCESLDGFEEGDEVKVEFSLRGREWESPQQEMRYFNSLEVWAIERVGAGAPASGPFDEEPPLPDGPPMGEDDIPF